MAAGRGSATAHPGGACGIKMRCPVQRDVGRLDYGL